MSNPDTQACHAARMSFSKALDLIRLARLAAMRRGGISLEEICEEFGVAHRTAQRMTDALGNKLCPETEGRLRHAGALS